MAAMHINILNNGCSLLFFDLKNGSEVKREANDSSEVTAHLLLTQEYALFAV